MKKDKQIYYTIERVFLGKIQTDEFVGNIIKKHGNNINVYLQYDYEKPLKTL